MELFNFYTEEFVFRIADALYFILDLIGFSETINLCITPIFAALMILGPVILIGLKTFFTGLRIIDWYEETYCHRPTPKK